MSVRIKSKIGVGYWIVGLTIAATLTWLAAWRLIGFLELHVLGKTFEAQALARKVMTVGVARHLVVPAIFVAELALVGWADSSVRRILVRPSRSVRSDMAVYAITITRVFKFLTVPLTLGLVMISAEWLHQRLVYYTGLPLTVAGLPIWLQVLGLFAVYTFFDYWAHRIDHSPMFWPLHRYHHAAEDFCVLTSDRVHPAAFTDLVIACSMVVLGGSANAFVVLYITIGAIRHVIHSRINSDFGWVGRFLVQSPRHHRLHHALEIPEGFGNFGLCPIWDRLFGTWREPPQSTWVIGVPSAYRHGAWIVADLWRDYAEFWNNSLRWVRSGEFQASEADGPG